MIDLSINKTGISVSARETLVEGGINSVLLKFSFSAEWDGLIRTAVFSNGETAVSVQLSSDECFVPWEVLASPGELFVALRGTGNGGNVVICTENVGLGQIKESKANAEIAETAEATPNVIDVLLEDMEAAKSAISALEQGSGQSVQGDYATESFVRNYHDSTKQNVITDLATIRNNANAVSGKESAGKITVDGVEKTASTHTLSWTDGGITHSYEVVTV